MADRRLQVFQAVAKQSSFTKAAETLFMTQPAVTFQIKQLEEHFNTRLFDRGHGKISLTTAGEVVLEYADRILSLSAELDTRISELTGEVQGLLLIGASMTIAEFMLPRVLGEFKVAYPGVKARLTVANSETVEHAVAAHSLDLGLIEAPSHLPTLSTEECCEDELQVVCAPVHPLAKLLPIGAVLYLFVPDLAPGPIDDAAVIWLGSYLFVELCPPEVVQEHVREMTSIIDGEFRTVEDESPESNSTP